MRDCGIEISGNRTLVDSVVTSRRYCQIRVRVRVRVLVEFDISAVPVKEEVIKRGDGSKHG